MTYSYIQLDAKDHPTWQELLRLGLANADSIEFNVLYKTPGAELEHLLERFGGSKCVLSRSEKDQRLYVLNHRICFPVTVPLVKWLEESTFGAFAGNVMEDPSFVKQAVELIGTITHERLCRVHNDYAATLSL